MVDLILRPSGLAEKLNKPWALQLRDHGPVETDYHSLCHVSDEIAARIIDAGAPYWLFGKPDWEERRKAAARERARALREEADKLEADNQ